MIVHSALSTILSTTIPCEGQPVKSHRIRRTAEDARAAILDVAEQRLRDAGPDALRLQDVAAAAGMSHSTLLHHFGSREGLMHAVYDRAAISLQDDLVRALGPDQPDGSAMLDRVAHTFIDRGHARVIAWLLLTGHNPLVTPASRAGWQAIAKATHARRGKKRKPSFEDTQFTVLLSWMAVFAQAIAGRALNETAGLPADAATEKRFRSWLAGLLEAHLA
jgi:AcrR family transcriptional regulator